MKTVVFQNDNLYEWSITPGPGVPPQWRGTACSVNTYGRREGGGKNIASHESRQNTTLKGQFVMGISGTSGQLYKCMPHHAECGPNIHTHRRTIIIYTRERRGNCFFLLLFRVSICISLSLSLHCVRRFRRSWNNSNPRRLIYRVITIATAGEFWFFFPTGRN